MTQQCVNLVPRDVRRRRTDRIWRARWGAIVTGSAAIVALGVTGLRIGSDSGLRLMREDVDRMGAHRLEIEAELARTNDLIGRARASAGAATLLEERPDWGALLTMLDALRQDRVSIDRVELETWSTEGTIAPPARGSRIALGVSGIARDLQQAQAFALEIERSGLFDNVEPLRTSPFAAGGDAFVAFELDLELLAGEQHAEVHP